MIDPLEAVNKLHREHPLVLYRVYALCTRLQEKLLSTDWELLREMGIANPKTPGLLPASFVDAVIAHYDATPVAA